MNPCVVSAEVNIFNGFLAGSIPFERGLNILSGENGTGKTQLLREIKMGHIRVSTDTSLKILAFSPKRNSERKTIERIFQEVRQQNRLLSNYLQQRMGRELQDKTFEDYASFAEVYFFAHEEQSKDGGNRIDKMNKVTCEFNTVMRKIFPNYELVSEWDSSRGSPDIKLRKEGQEITMESLSLGEQEILALVINLYIARDSNDVFLIDEPEIHLNWHLEERLFDFFDWFCSEFDKQVIVATHSRVVFKAPFLAKAQFLFWENGRITFGRNIPDEQRLRIAGEGIDIIKLGEFSKVTFFVEDRSHREVIQAIAQVLKGEIAVSECSNSSNVVSLFRLSLKEEGWQNCFFLIDGDNQRNPFPDEERFIHLDKYCIENYLLDPGTAARVAGKPEEAVRNAILAAVKANKETILKQNKWFEFLFDRLTLQDITESSLEQLDAAAIFPTYLRELDMERSVYIEKYLKLLHEESKLEAVFPERLIRAIRG